MRGLQLSITKIFFMQINFDQYHNPIMISMQRVYDVTQNCLCKPKTLQIVADDLIRLSHFFNCTNDQALLFTLLIQFYIEDHRVGTKTIIDHLGIRKSRSYAINDALKVFIDREWLITPKDTNKCPFLEYRISQDIIQAVLTGVLNSKEEMPIEDSFQLMTLFDRVLEERVHKRMSYTEFIEWTDELLRKHRHIALSTYIEQLGLLPEQQIYFLYVCSEYCFGIERFDLDNIITDFDPPAEIQYRLRNEFRVCTHFLLADGFLKETTCNDVFSSQMYLVTEKTIRSFDKNAAIHKPKEDGICEHLEAGMIAHKHMYYDAPEKKMVNKLHKVLSRDSFMNLTERLHDMGMKKGISILLYGDPGTGKTETVYQLAKSSNRCVMVADASKIRSKWVGETEKNMKALFNEYKKSCKENAETPILLFNEADSILGKRQSVSDRVDHMENAMQNILLHELENFEGIFIATTNLVDNLDNAFDRRFLYKIRFEKPGTQTLVQIWKSKFPELSTAVLKRICSKYTLSGAQIDNVRKKASVDTLLDEKVKINEAYILQLVEQELILEKKNHRDKIGFIR